MYDLQADRPRLNTNAAHCGHRNVGAILVIARDDGNGHPACAEGEHKIRPYAAPDLFTVLLLASKQLKSRKR
jgi:hypothetical protein